MKINPALLKLAKAGVNKSVEAGLSAGIKWEATLFSLCFGPEEQKGRDKERNDENI